jgi:hypothetical protein
MKRAMLLALVGTMSLVGCDEGRVLQSQTSVPEDPAVPEVPVEPDAGAPDALPGADAEAPTGYEAMCRHYCQTLEQTLLYRCLEAEGPSAGCAGRFEGTTAQCFDLRCVPMKVPPYLCPVQCDSLATFYQPACARADLAGDPLCALPAGEHDRLCRQGCTIGPP